MSEANETQVEAQVETVEVTAEAVVTREDIKAAKQMVAEMVATRKLQLTAIKELKASMRASKKAASAAKKEAAEAKRVARIQKAEARLEKLRQQALAVGKRREAKAKAPEATPETLASTGAAVPGQNGFGRIEPVATEAVSA